MTIEQITDLARALSRAQDRLAELVEGIRAIQRREARKRAHGLRTRAAAVRHARQNLHEAVDRHRSLFDKPRTRAHDGVKFGLRKQPGRLVIADPDRTLALIREQLPEKAGELIKTKETVPAAGLKDLTLGELARIGVSLTNSADRVAIGSAADELDRFVDALLEEVDGEQADAA